MKPFTQAALVSDALNLGPHWVYDQSQLALLYPHGVTEFTPPASSYHGKKQAGDLTHTGDQLYFLSESIEQNDGEYSEDAWCLHWLFRMRTYGGYVDTASKDTLASEGRVPSASAEIAGAVRAIPILDLELPLEDAITIARSQTALTHGAEAVVECAEFIVRSVYHIKTGLDFLEAFQLTVKEADLPALRPEMALATACAADPTSPLEVASSLGVACSLTSAFPLALYYALHHGESFMHCTSKNAMAGGDTTARGLLLSAFFTARDGAVGETLFSQVRLPDA